MRLDAAQLVQECLAFDLAGQRLQLLKRPEFRPPAGQQVELLRVLIGRLGGDDANKQRVFDVGGLWVPNLQTVAEVQVRRMGGDLQDANRNRPVGVGFDARALRVFGPMTADGVADNLALSCLSIRPRLSELRRLGRIVPTGERRANASGKLATVWRLT